MNNAIKSTIATITSMISAVLGVLYIPVLLMVFCNLVDYATGLMASPYRKEDINSYKSIKGIIKKVGMWLLVLCGSMIDELIKYSTEACGVELRINFLVAAFVAIWIICNELISIIENLKDVGVPIPGFLEPIVKNIRGQVEKRADVSEEGEVDDRETDQE